MKMVRAVVAAAALGLVMASASVQSARTGTRLGFVDLTAPGNSVPGVAEFWKRLAELGWVEGSNLTVVRRFAEGRIDRLPALTADVVASNVDILVT